MHQSELNNLTRDQNFFLYTKKLKFQRVIKPKLIYAQVLKL